MPGNDPDLATCISYAKEFEEAGADLFHISHGTTSDTPPELKYEANDNYNWIVAMGIEMNNHVAGPVITVNGVRNINQANSILEQGVDFVALARGYLCDLEWLDKSMAGNSVNECLGCPKCLRFTGVKNCVLYQEK